MENWKEIPEFPGFYVSDLGRVKDYGKILPTHHGQDGQLVVMIRVDGKQYTRKLSKLVANAFIPGEGIAKPVNGDPNDCSVDNLTRSRKTWGKTTRTDITNLLDLNKRRLLRMAVTDPQTGEEKISIEDVKEIFKIIRQAIAP